MRIGFGAAAMDSLPRASSSAVLKRVGVAVALAFLVVALLEQEAPNVETAKSQTQLRLLKAEHAGTPTWYGHSTAQAHLSQDSWSWTDAKNFCLAQDKKLCKRDEYCPHGPGKEPIGRAKHGNAWAPAGDGPHTWVQVGILNDDASKTCQTQQEAFYPTPNDFWETQMGYNCFQWIACCSTPTSYTLSWHGRSTAHAYQSHQRSWSDAVNFCAGQEKRLCKRDEYCPHGSGNEPIGRAKHGDSWAPAGDSPHTWVQVGVLEDDVSKTCQTHEEAFDSIPDDVWATEMGIDYFQWVACCSDGEDATADDKEEEDGEEETDNSELLPRIVHQSYKTAELPTAYRKWRDHCIELNPDWEFKVWTDEDNRKLVEEDYPELLEMYDGYDVHIKRIDMARYLYLHKFGGVYMDMDMTCLNPFESEFDKPPHFVVASDRFGQLPNAFMVSTPGHPILDRILQALPARRHENVLGATGPTFLTGQLHEGDPSEYRVLPNDMIYGESWADEPSSCRSIEQCKKKFPDALTVSFWTRSWMGSSSKNLETGFED